MAVDAVTKKSKSRPIVRRVPGLDGARGLFILFFIAGHYGIRAFEGAWIIMNMFFVMSAYLLASLILIEKQRTGRISFLGFYRRRIRRVIPLLTVLLLFVATYSWIFQLPPTRKQTGGDILATMGFVLNWRLIDRADDYFGELERPSLLRHLWSLSVEEQFYIIVPILMTVLIATRSRRKALLICAVLTGISAWRTMSIGVATLQTQSLSYYGTDTRLQAFTIGVALALIAPLGTVPKSMTPSRISLLGLGSLLFLTIGFFTVEPMSVFMFEMGGMTLFNIITAGLVLSLAVPVLPKALSLFSNPVLIWVGERSYGIYLWHWPLHLMIKWQWPSLGFWGTFIAAFTLTILLSWITFRWLEMPIIRGGLRNLSSRIRSGRFVATIMIFLVIISGTVLTRTVVMEDAPVTFDVPPLVAGTERYEPRDGTLKVGLLGDSVATGLHQHFQKDVYSDIELVDLSALGCDFSLWTPAGINAGPITPYPDCISLMDNLESRIQANHVDVVLMVGLQTSAISHFDDDGNLYSANDPEYLSILEAALDDLLEKSIRGGSQEFIVVTTPCRFGMDSTKIKIPEFGFEFIENYPEDAKNYADPIEFNTWLSGWAMGRDLPVLDLYEKLGCGTGFKPELNGITLYKDYLHFTPAASAMLWSWLAPEARNLFGKSSVSPNES